MESQSIRLRIVTIVTFILLSQVGASAGVGRAVVRGAERAAARSVNRAVARSAEKVATRSAQRTAARSTGKSAARVVQKAQRAAVLDSRRDALTRASVLRKRRPVFRYLNDSTLSRQMRRGFSKGTHFTSVAKPGRPFSPRRAQQRLGMTRTPSWRVSATLRKGDQVRFNKVLGGNKAGIGEASLKKGVSWNRVRRVVPLSKPKSPLGARLLKRVEKQGLR